MVADPGMGKVLDDPIRHLNEIAASLYDAEAKIVQPSSLRIRVRLGKRYGGLTPRRAPRRRLPPRILRGWISHTRLVEPQSWMIALTSQRASMSG
jgi:hypothetical protein